MADDFETYASALDSPAASAAAVTPNDSTVLDTTRGLWIGGAGDVAVYMKGSTTSVTFAGIAAGTLIPIRVDRVLATGTTATSIVALW